jgi:pilus assembly protein CpaB
LSNKIKAILIILAGIVLVAIGVFASYLLIQRFQAQQGPEIVQEETVKTDVVIVTRDLFLGDTLTAGDLEIASVAVEVVPRNAVTDPEEAVGKFIKTDLVQGEMLLTHNLADPTNKVKDLSFILADDHVLFAWQPGDLMTSEDMVQRGDIVDIFATITKTIEPEEDEIDPETGEPVEPETRQYTLDTFQRIDVTALIVDIIQQEGGGGQDLLPGQTAEGDPQQEVNIRSYLLALDPQNALILKHLTDTGANFDIVLRAPTSTIPFELTPVTEEFIVEFYGLEIIP